MQVLIWGLKCLLSMLRCMLGSVKGVKSENPKEKGEINIRFTLKLTKGKLTPFTLPSMHLSMLSRHFRPHISACISVSFRPEEDYSSS